MSDKLQDEKIVVGAVRWYKNGDHPDDNSHMVYPNPRSMTQFEPFLSEGKVVGFGPMSSDLCPSCKKPIWPSHGMLESDGMDVLVCPGEWIVTLFNGKRYAMSNDVYEMFRDTELLK